MFSNICRRVGQSAHLHNRAHGVPALRNFSALSRQKPTISKTSQEIRRNIHPVILVTARFVLRVMAVLTGRGIRKWWSSLPSDKKLYFKKEFRKNRFPLFVGFSGLSSFFGIYYALNLQAAPITGRKRFIAFSPKEIDELAELTLDMHLDEFKDRLYPGHHIFVKRVRAIAEHILESNRDIEEIYSKKWTVSVVNSPIQNAFVLPNGNIFVFSGMLGLCENNDQLACVLSHEIAHAILNHSAEIFSRTNIVDVFVIFVLVAIWALIPANGVAALTHFIFEKMTNIYLKLPFSRKLETEADLVGLELAAKACYDVRESSAFWAKMALIHDELMDGQTMPEFLSSHPANDKRSEELDKMMPAALNKRVECKCQSLPRLDPRCSVEALRMQIKAAQAWRDRLIEVRLPR